MAGDRCVAWAVAAAGVSVEEWVMAVSCLSPGRLFADPNVCDDITVILTKVSIDFGYNVVFSTHP
jgi:hypothetical protein